MLKEEHTIGTHPTGFENVNIRVVTVEVAYHVPSITETPQPPRLPTDLDQLEKC